jgi:hypothetical protein
MGKLQSIPLLNETIALAKRSLELVTFNGLYLEQYKA